MQSVPKERLKISDSSISAVPAGLRGLAKFPGVKTPGYYQMFLRNKPMHYYKAQR